MIKQGMTVQQANRCGIYMCSQDSRLVEVAQHMVDEDISSLVVVDQGGFLAGIVTRVDLLRAYIDQDDWADLPVSQFMIRNVYTVTPQDLLQYVAQLLLEKNIHRVVVVEEQSGRKKPVGVISAADLVYHMVKDRATVNKWMRGSE